MVSKQRCTSQIMWSYQTKHQRCQRIWSKFPEMPRNFLKMHNILLFFCTRFEQHFLKSGNFQKTGISETCRYGAGRYPKQQEVDMSDSKNQSLGDQIRQILIQAHKLRKYQSRFKGSANVQHTDYKIPLFGRGGISEDLKSILITV